MRNQISEVKTEKPKWDLEACYIFQNTGITVSTEKKPRAKEPVLG